jgi:hypothetical protein
MPRHGAVPPSADAPALRDDDACKVVLEARDVRVEALLALVRPAVVNGDADRLGDGGGHARGLELLQGEAAARADLGVVAHRLAADGGAERLDRAGGDGRRLGLARIAPALLARGLVEPGADAQVPLLAVVHVREDVVVLDCRGEAGTEMVESDRGWGKGVRKGKAVRAKRRRARQRRQERRPARATRLLSESYAGKRGLAQRPVLPRSRSPFRRSGERGCGFRSSREARMAQRLTHLVRLGATTTCEGRRRMRVEAGTQVSGRRIQGPAGGRGRWCLRGLKGGGDSP